MANPILLDRLRKELEPQLDAEEERIINDVCKLLIKGDEMSPQLALQKWLELFSVRRLRTRVLRAQRKAGSGEPAEPVPRRLT